PRRGPARGRRRPEGGGPDADPDTHRHGRPAPGGSLFPRGGRRHGPAGRRRLVPRQRRMEGPRRVPPGDGRPARKRPERADRAGRFRGQSRHDRRAFRLVTPRDRSRAMTRPQALLTLTALLALSATPARAAEAPKESDYYAITTLPIPAGVVLEVGALELLPGDVLAVATRRGDIYLVDR